MTDPDFKQKCSRWSRATRSIEAALVLDDFDGLDTILTARLTEPERIRIAGSLLSACHPQNAIDLCEMAVKHVGYPGAPFENTWVDAKWWASYANPKELKAYLAAAFDALDGPERDRFRQWVKERADA